MTERDRILHDIERDIPHGKWAVEVISRAEAFKSASLKAERTRLPDDITKMHESERALFAALQWPDPAQAVIE